MVLMTQTNHPDSGDLEIDNLPNRLTMFRVALIPLVIGCLFFTTLDFAWAKQYTLEFGWIAGMTFILASVTDFFDGYIARKRNIVTVFGSFLDPIADKFLVVSSLIMLQELGRIPALLVIILVIRELYMTSLRLLANTEGLQVPVGSLGKWKTGMQMTAIPNIMINDMVFGISTLMFGTIVIYLAAFLSLFSAVEYSVSLIRNLKMRRLEKKRLKKLKK